MSDISTCKQKVDTEKFSQGFDGTFRKRQKGKPGTTIYVARDGQLVEKGPDFVIVEAPLLKADELTANMNRYTEAVIGQMAVPKHLLEPVKHENSRRYSMSVAERTLYGRG